MNRTQPPSFMRSLRQAMAMVTALLLALLAGCESPTPRTSSTPSANWVALQRSVVGMPATPAYVVTLFEDGRVIFEGLTAVNRRGTFSKMIPREQAQAVLRELDLINFWEREPRYDVERVRRGGDDLIGRQVPPDAPWDIITARSAGRFKRIDCLFFAPRELLDLKSLVERTVGLVEWTGEVKQTTR